MLGVPFELAIQNYVGNVYDQFARSDGGEP